MSDELVGLAKEKREVRANHCPTTEKTIYNIDYGKNKKAKLNIGYFAQQKLSRFSHRNQFPMAINKS